MEEFMKEEKQNEEAGQKLKEYIAKRKQDLEKKKEEDEQRKNGRI